MMKKILGVLLCCLIAHPVAADNTIVLITDPRVLAIPVHENHEPMIDLMQQKTIAYGPSPLIANNLNYTKMRQTLYIKLQEAQKRLPDGLRLQVYEGYRSLALQQHIFTERYVSLHKLHPGLTHQPLFIEATKFVSPVKNLDGSMNIPPHSTGAAVDVYLIDQQGKVVDMGILLDDTYNDLTGKYCKTNSTAISASAKRYRKVMGDALRSVGLVNYPTEYWHWSYGDRYWAYQTQHPFAIYNSLVGN